MLILLASKDSALCSLTNHEIEHLLVRPDVSRRMKNYLSFWRMDQYNMGKNHVLGLEPFMLPVEDKMNAINPEVGIIERIGH